MTVRSATLVRSALAGAVVCLIAVGVTAPALAGAGDRDEPCADVGPVEALLHGRACAEGQPGHEPAPGSLLNPQFPDFPDYPGLDDEDDEPDDATDEDSDGDESEDADSEDSGSSDDAEDTDADTDTEDTATAAVEGDGPDPTRGAAPAPSNPFCAAAQANLEAIRPLNGLVAQGQVPRDELARTDGHRSAVMVPLLFGHAFHARVDVPGAVATAAARLPGLDITISPVLGGHRGLPAAALRRLEAVAGPLRDPGLGVVLAAIGSSHPAANAAVAGVVAGWTRRFGWNGGSPAFATAATPTVPEAVAALRAGGARRVAVAQWILAPGLLPDRIVRDATAAGAPVAAALGADPDVADAILARYDARAETPLSRNLIA